MTVKEFFGIKKSSSPVADVPTPLIGQSLYQKYNFETASLERNVRNGYEGNSLIAGAISFWQFAFGQAMFDCEDKKILALLQNPNPEQSESDFKLSIITNVLCGGETFILAGKNAIGQVVQLWNYHAGLMQPIYNEFGFLKGYLYYNPNLPAQRKEYAIEDVVHLKWLARNIYNPNKGISPISQVFKEINLDNEVGRSVYSYLKNDLLRGKIARITPGAEPPTPKQRADMKQQFIQQSTGDSKGFPIFMTDIEPLENITGTFDELDTETISKESESRVANVFGVSPILLEWCVGLNKAILNNVKEADKRFNTRKFAPLLDIFSEVLTNGFKNKFGFSGNYTIGFNKSRMESFQELQAERETRFLNQYEKGAITFPELRKEIDRADVSEKEVANALRNSPQGAQQFMSLVNLYATKGLKGKTCQGIAVNTFGYDATEAAIMFPDVLPEKSDTVVTNAGKLNPAFQENV